MFSSRLTRFSRFRSFSLSTRSQYPSTDTYHHPNVVPTYYQERKKTAPQTDVMHHLDSSSSSLSASITRPKSKIPVEFTTENGHKVHPSGFIVPNPRAAPAPHERLRDTKIQTAAVVERADEETGLSFVTAAIRTQDSKIPVEVQLDDGTAVHPSGFVPPTPATDFSFPLTMKTVKPEKTLVDSGADSSKPNPRSTETDPRKDVKQDVVEKETQIDDVIDSDKGELMPELVDEILHDRAEASMNPRKEKTMGDKANQARPI